MTGGIKIQGIYKPKNLEKLHQGVNFNTSQATPTPAKKFFYLLIH
jgi:hypothetical protein